MPGWLSWLERTAHRVLSKCSDFFLGYREAAGSNPAPGTSHNFMASNNIPETKFILFYIVSNSFLLF